MEFTEKLNKKKGIKKRKNNMPLCAAHYILLDIAAVNIEFKLL
jgi:hypothetical protein